MSGLWFLAPLPLLPILSLLHACPCLGSFRLGCFLAEKEILAAHSRAGGRAVSSSWLASRSVPHSAAGLGEILLDFGYHRINLLAFPQACSVVHLVLGF